MTRDGQRGRTLRRFQSALHADAAVIEDREETVPGAGVAVVPHEDRVGERERRGREPGLILDDREARIARSNRRLRVRDNRTRQAHKERRGEVTYPAAQHEPDDSVR